MRRRRYRGPLTRRGRFLVALGSVPIAVAGLHRMADWEIPLVALGALLIAVGLMQVIRGRRMDQEHRKEIERG